jgi:tRNA1(Val) A37 N6-methylase TrmN6
MTEPVEDALLGGRLRMLQPASGYRSAIDPILLAAVVPAKSAQRVLDMGCGVGTAMLCLAARIPNVTVVGLEIQEEMAALARRNIALNGFEDRAMVIVGDVALPPVPVSGDSFDHVIANPPYLEAERARPSATPSKALATVEGDADLETWIRFAVRRVVPQGTVTFIHRADRLGDLLAGMSAGLGGLKVFPFWPRQDEPAKRVIVQGRKGSRAPLEMLPGMALHREDGAFTAEAEAVLRGAQGITL